MNFDTITQLVIVCLVLLGNVTLSSTCTEPFEGFGVFLGSVGHISSSTPGTAQKVIDKVYHDLGIRHYRTSYESQFSLSSDTYNISCTNSFTCTWIEIQEIIALYENISIFASIWSPPHYMKNPFLDTLEEEYEHKFYQFIKNITTLIKDRFNLTIEKVSPVNEPENLFAPWEHTNMGPHQMCRMISSFNDSLVSLCPENSYFWMSELYSNYTDEDTGVNCDSSCEIYATHAYTLNIDWWSRNHLLAYYDPARYLRKTKKPMWMTEVSSTFGGSDRNQMEEGIDFAINIVNFLGTTCVQRYYFWYAFTQGASGESLIWGFDDQGRFVLPKKYFVYKHFTQASFGGPKNVSECIDRQGNRDNDDDDSADGNFCLLFGKENVVLVNKEKNNYTVEGLQCQTSLCCTTQEFDWLCMDARLENLIVPKFSVCSCKIDNISFEGISDIRPLMFSFNATTYTNEVP